MEFVWATPNASQTLVFGRPPATRPSVPSLKDINALPLPSVIVGSEIRWLAFKGEGGEWVPALLVTPEGKPGPFPLVVATHGLLSQKMQMVSQMGPALIKRNFAVLAIDLPRHGEREGSGLEMLDRSDPKLMFSLWRQAVVNIRQGMDLALSMDLIDDAKPVTLLGYSLGSWISTIAGASDARVGSMVLMVGGATDLSPELMALPTFAASDPRAAIAAFSPRPLLMVNARNDRTVTPAMAERLFSAANEPKTQRWYDMGHILRDPAYEDTAQWVVDHFRQPAPHPQPPRPAPPKSQLSN